MAGYNTHRQEYFLSMKTVRIVAMVLGAVVVLYVLVTVFLPQWMIVGIHFRWPWK
jgi:hypothetical protein